MYIRYQNAYVEINGKRYKQNDIPVGTREFKSYIDSCNALSQEFQGYKYKYDMAQYVQNRFFIYIPISPSAYQGDLQSDAVS